MSELNHQDDQPVQPTREGAPRTGNFRRNVIKGIAAFALVASGATLAAWRPWQNNGATPAQAREVIAGHQFDQPRIESVVDTHTVVEGRDTLDITLKLPTNPIAAADMKQYAKNNAVEWLVPSGVTSYTVGKDPKTGKYSAVGPGFALSSFPVIPGGEALTVKDGTANIVEHPNVDYPVGTEVALFTATEAMTSNSKDLTITDGSQYLGTVEKTPEGWGVMPDQPQLPDQVTTNTSPWQIPHPGRTHRAAAVINIETTRV